MEVKNLGGRRGEVLIYDQIGEAFWSEGLTARGFNAMISDLDVDELTVRVNSPGGDAFDGIAIMNTLKRHPARVTTIVDGLAASAASIIAVGGADRVVMAEGAQIMIHDAWSWPVGNADALRKEADDLDKLSQDMAEIYARVAGTPVDEWRDAMREETWFTAKEAVACGLAHAVEGADEIVDAHAFAKGRVFAMFKHKGREDAPAPSMMTRLGDAAPDEAPVGAEGGTVEFLKNVAARLGLADAELDEEKVMAALEEVLDEQAEDTTGTVEQAAPVEGAETAPEAEQSEDRSDDETVGEDTVVLDKAVYEDLLNRATRGDQVDEEQKHDRAVALVEEHGIKAGRLLGWQRDAWVEKAVENFDATEQALMRLAPGINLADKGRAGSDEKTTAQDTNKGLSTAANQAGLFGPPTV